MTNAGSGASLAGEEEEMLLLAAVLRGFLPQEDLFIAPNIPPKKLENGCAKCGVPASETIFALIDTTSFGSAKNCLLFGREGIYFHNDWSATTPGSFAIPYREFVARAVSKGSWCEIRFGPKECVDTAGSNMPTAKALAILCAVQKALQGCRRPGGSEGI
jgi:hypothetical protein